LYYYCIRKPNAIAEEFVTIYTEPTSQTPSTPK
jgi:hypothetical protein